jgi:NET1-associated nuclear protein 1 (U3 small nucleolar RNA-associated protein 17)
MFFELERSRWSCLYTRSSFNCSYFIVTVESTIRIHSATTGTVVSTLDNSTPSPKKKREHPGTLTSALLNPTNPFQLITGSLDGYIKIWDILDATLLQTIDIDQPVISMCAHGRFNDSLFVAVERPTKKISTQGIC